MEQQLSVICVVSSCTGIHQANQITSSDYWLKSRCATLFKLWVIHSNACAQKHQELFLRGLGNKDGLEYVKL